MMSMVIARHTAQHFPFLGNMHTIIYGIESKAELRNSFPGQKRKKKKRKKAPPQTDPSKSGSRIACERFSKPSLNNYRMSRITFKINK